MKPLSIPRGVSLYGFFSLPRGRLLKVCAEPCTYAPGYLQSNKPRWPSGSAGMNASDKTAEAAAVIAKASA